MFATGIECSYPMIRDRTYRVDALRTTDHYRRWREDLALTVELGIPVLRYGVAYHEVNTAAGRYPWVTLYTPVNEIFICAKCSARFGWWNEQLASERAYGTTTRHLVQATLLGMREILAAQPLAVFIQSESSEYTHAMCDCPPTRARADGEHQTRFLAPDLRYSREVRGDVYAWLLANGMPADEYRTYMTHGLHERCVMGNDYYVTNERVLQHDGSVSHGQDAVAWLWKQWQNILRMREEGVPVLGFTWYSLVDQVDWDTALREANGTVNPLGLYDIDRKLRPVGALVIALGVLSPDRPRERSPR
ncbi:MAG TPA: hypothetical protein VGD56_02445 [Gemmatirosa sp.]